MSTDPTFEADGIVEAVAAQDAQCAGESPDKPVSLRRRMKRWLWHIYARLFLLACLTALFVAKIIGRRRRPVGGDKLEILLTGRFDSPNWILNHLGPLSASKKCSKLWMVSTNPVPTLPKVAAIYPANWLMKVVGATRARLWTFLWAVLRKRPDIVGGFHIMPNGIAAAIAGRLAGSRSMYFCVGGPAEVRDGGIHSADSYFTAMETGDRVVESRFLKVVAQFDTIITMGTRAVDFFRGKGIRADFHVVSGGVDPTRFHRDEKAAAEYDLILTGRLVEVKRIDVFLHAVKKTTEKIPDIKAVVVGAGKLRDELLSLSQTLGIDRNVEFVGFKPDIENWLRRSKVFVLTSDSEGLALSMMEAMMCGLPVVVSDVGDLGDLVENGVNGYLVPRRSPELFAEHIVELLTDSERLKAFSQAARHSAMKYETKATIKRWDDILRGYRQS